MANRDGICFGTFAIVKNGAAYDFVITGAEPKVDNPGAANQLDKAVRQDGWFDFSQVTSGTEYDEEITLEGPEGQIKFHVVGRKLGDAITVAQIKTGVTDEVKDQGNAS